MRTLLAILVAVATWTECHADNFSVRVPWPDQLYRKQFEVVGHVSDKPFSIGVSYVGGPVIFGPDTTFEDAGKHSSTAIIIEVTGAGQTRIESHACSEVDFHCGRQNSYRSIEFPAGHQLITVFSNVSISGPYAFNEPLEFRLTLPEGISLREIPR